MGAVKEIYGEVISRVETIAEWAGAAEAVQAVEMFTDQDWQKYADNPATEFTPRNPLAGADDLTVQDIVRNVAGRYIDLFYEMDENTASDIANSYEQGFEEGWFKTIAYRYRMRTEQLCGCGCGRKSAGSVLRG